MSRTNQKRKRQHKIKRSKEGFSSTTNKKGEPSRARQRKRDKVENRQKDSRSGVISGRGPAGTITAMLVDTILNVVYNVFKFLWYKMTLPVFNWVWELFFSEMHGVFAGKEKDGDCYNSSFFRYGITILIPPVGVFMAKGIAGWPAILISTILTFFHIFPGIIYAIVVTYDSRYADRYQQKQLDDIERIKKLRLDNGDSSDAKYGLIPIILSMSLIVLMIYIFIRIAQMMNRLNKN